VVALSQLSDSLGSLRFEADRRDETIAAAGHSGLAPKGDAISLMGSVA
jgi:hypothetical protein